ncbi:Exoenzymes regulatory protein AepA in lipid-linked oligosaccharide synthesis cluster [Olavius sp. associated proteobacterium Delta 1]|nr:Exoenzymes regulatory protein AepA in lipid-linked oligosaccharide synthesis cluster [Olavius sp. associated proteobacterium Delta 1]
MELAIFSTRIFTGNPAQPWAEALKITDERITNVGSNAAVKDACGNNTEKLELPGMLVTPGLVDAHCHFVSLGRAFQMVNLRNASSLAEVRERIQKAVKSRKPGEWIIGRGWNHHQWRDRLEPTRQDLDDLTPDNPAMMVRACGHSIWVNTGALERAAITRDTPNPYGGQIDKDPASGEPTGMLREARDLIEDHIPLPTLEDRKQMALAAQEDALRNGITAVHTCETLTEWEALAALEAEGKLKLRVYHLLPPDDLEKAAARGITAGNGSHRLWFNHVKLFADGSLGSGTALMHEPYTDDSAECGIACLEREDLEDKIRLAYSRGCDVAIHAIGDLALTNALESIAAARKQYPGEHRDRIEHVQIYRPQDLALFHDLGVVASVQPVFLGTDWAPADKRWGSERCRNAYAWKSLLEAKLRVQFGSDTPVESINPLYGIHAAVTRQDPSGQPIDGWFPDQKLSLEESLEGFSAVAAWNARREEQLGSIAPGKWADLTVLEQDLFKLSPAEWRSVKTAMTVVHGEVVYRKG